jgi:large subunit ribosomal protein L6
MSKIGVTAITIPDGVTITIEDSHIQVEGPKGTQRVPRLAGVDVVVNDGECACTLSGSANQHKMNWGTMRSLINNAVQGVTEGFSKTLEVNGVGYRAEMAGNVLKLKVGFSHLVELAIPEELTVVVDGNKITVSGINKELVGQMAADIRKVKKPEPYLGKGIKYQDEVIRRKAGKKAATA